MHLQIIRRATLTVGIVAVLALSTGVAPGLIDLAPKALAAELAQRGHDHGDGYHTHGPDGGQHGGQRGGHRQGGQRGHDHGNGSHTHGPDSEQHAHDSEGERQD
jgi:hypothetical protein